MGAVDEYIITDKLIDSVNQFINNAKNNPSYPVRRKFDVDMLNFAENLIHKEEEACKLVSKFQKNMVDNVDLVSIINRYIITLQYIRLNGAVIGGLVGMFIAIVNLLLA